MIPEKWRFFVAHGSTQQHVERQWDVGNLVEGSHNYLTPDRAQGIFFKINHEHQNAKKRFPTKDVVSRARLRFDVALMLLHRCWNWASWQEKKQSRAGITGYVRYQCWDSSPQFGKDSLMMLIVSIQGAILQELFSLFLELSTIWRRRTYYQTEHEFLQQFEDAETRAREVDVMSLIAKHIYRHNLPAVQVGAGASLFPHKSHCLVHAVRLENFTNGPAAILISGICSPHGRLRCRTLEEVVANPDEQFAPLLRPNAYG